MKKAIMALIAVAALCAVSCKSDKCSCTYEIGNMTVKDQVISRPDNKKCSEVSTSDLNVAGIKIDASDVVKVSCKNHNE